MNPTVAPTWKQHLAWQKLEDQVTEEVMFGGAAGGGKSWLGCEWLFKYCDSYRGIRAFIGRDELKKIKQSSYVTMHKMLNQHNIKHEHHYKFNSQESAFKFHNGSQIDLLELKYKPSDPMYERFGSLEYTIGWVEEGGEVEQDAKDMIFSRIGRHYNDKYNILGTGLITCNPKKNWMYHQFYLPWKNGSLSSEKAFIQALANENDRAESGYAKKLARFTGAMGARLRDGNWEYDNDPAALIEADAIHKVWESFFWDLNYTGKYYITVDVARFGKDSSTIVLWQGWTGKLYRYKGLDTVQLAAKIREFMGLYNVPSSRVCVDADGVGGGVVDQLKCVEFVNNSRPLPAPINPNTDAEGKPLPENYRSLKAQCYYRTAEKVNMEVIKLKIEKTTVDTTEQREQQSVNQEMEQVKRKNVDGDGKLDVLPREDMVATLKRSPDYWSAIMQRYYFEIYKPNKSWV